MKKPLLSILVLLCLCPGISFGKLNAFFSYAIFDRPGNKPYIETYLNIVGRSTVLAVNANHKLQGKLEVNWVIRRGDEVVYVNKYNLLGPEVDSINGLIPDFIDQQRTTIDTGTFELELKISDKNSTDPAFTIKQVFSAHFPTNEVSISDIEMIESYTPSIHPGQFTKSGYDVVPFISGFYPREIKSIKFYAEIYRAKTILKGEYLIRYFITNDNNNQLMNDFAGTKKQTAEDVNVLLAEIPIDHLPSGNYQLSVEVLSRENKFITFRQVFFQRSNQEIRPVKIEDISLTDVNNTFVAGITNKDTLIDFIACLFPILSGPEIQIAENQIQLKDVRSMQQFIYYFWSKRDPLNPTASWIAYKTEVEKVNASFSTRNRKGYESDRGRVYLEYGPPNTIVNDDVDPNAYPYEIWHYYKLGNQSNRKFVFYANELSSNDYKLLHSDAIGELQDPAWELKLHSRSQQYGDMDIQNSEDIYGSKTKENFINPH